MGTFQTAYFQCQRGARDGDGAGVTCATCCTFQVCFGRDDELLAHTRERVFLVETAGIFECLINVIGIAVRGSHVDV